MTHAYTVGNVVKVKGQKVLMTISRTGLYIDQIRHAQCLWFDSENKLRGDHFPEDILELERI